jgi:hypothetical protein
MDGRLDMKHLIVLVGVFACAAAAAAVSGSELGRPGQWTCHRAKDGSLQAVLGVQSNENNGMLLVRCSVGKPSVSLKWDIPAGSRPTLVITRLDQAEPSSSLWPRSIDMREAEYPGDDAAYLQALRVGTTLVVRVSPCAVPVADAGSDGVSNGAPPTIDHPVGMTFSLSGLGAAMLEAQGSCGPK